MNLEQILSQDPSGNEVQLQMPNLATSIQEALAPFILLSIGISAVFVIFYVLSMFRRRKLENALFDIQRTIHEMNERDKARSKPVPSTVQPQQGHEKDRIIARTSE